ncbi:hypothetical protein T265_02585 [Opisthorchis viverrini]|uniref:Arrestin C-terminal-like domain-containing protein n=2 Tax=Opisthorchis viverrini TaxID=6198 RepID=A0A075A6A4_OPIVI|nr:hypothetical protein T265_02585 [Opisthorchis viverrini]KER31140.1 hypothetical protein T265_02585 [Opisthorchis viverrini]
MDESHKPGTRYVRKRRTFTFARIFKKSTPNGKVRCCSLYAPRNIFFQLTIYLGKRDFFDHLSHVDPIEGVVLVDPDYVKDRKVFIHLLGAFRYGHDEVDLMGMQYHSDLYLSTKQVYPLTVPVNSTGVISKSPLHLNSAPLEPPTLTRLQERLVRKLGTNAYPFYFQLPAYSASSVSLNVSTSDSGKPCRVDYELKAYVADEQDDSPQKRSSVRMVVRKLTYAPEEPGPQPSTEVIRDFLMSLGSLRVEVSLDKQKYHHGETMCVNVLVDNNSSRTVKRIKISVRQYARVLLHTAVTYKSTVAEIQSEEGFPITPSQTGWCKVYRVCPLLVANRDKTGLAMDGDLKHEDTNLASSTIEPPGRLSNEQIGISVQYKVKVRLTLGFGVSDVCLQLPFILTHPNPNEDNADKTAEFEDVLSSALLPNPMPTNIQTHSNEQGSPKPQLPSDNCVQQLAKQPNGGSVHMNGVPTATSPGALCISSSAVLSTISSKSPWASPQQHTLTSHANGKHTKNAVQSTLLTSINSAPLMNEQSLPAPRTMGTLLVPPQYTPHSSQTSPVHQLDANTTALLPLPIDSLFGSFNSDHHCSGTGTQSTVSEDDLMFEDFARFRLQTTALQHSIINEPKVS